MKTSNWIEYQLINKNRINEFEGYDRVVASCHIDNCGCIICYVSGSCDKELEPIDNEYILDEIYKTLENKQL